MLGKYFPSFSKKNMILVSRPVGSCQSVTQWVDLLTTGEVVSGIWEDDRPLFS